MNSKKRKYTFGSGCENIPNEEFCNQAGEYNKMGCEWKGGICKSVENFVGQRCNQPTEKFITTQTHDGESCKGGLCVRWWRAKN